MKTTTTNQKAAKPPHGFQKNIQLKITIAGGERRTANLLLAMHVVTGEAMMNVPCGYMSGKHIDATWEIRRTDTKKLVPPKVPK